MNIIFGLELEELVYPAHETSEAGTHYVGEQGLLSLLETHLGLTGYPTNNEYLRIEQYRQAIEIYMDSVEICFFQASFEADPLATAGALLRLRDELMLSGWDFEVSEITPNRLQILAAIESFIQDNNLPNIILEAGYADRFADVLFCLKDRQIPIQQIFLNEKRADLPPSVERLFSRLEQKGIKIQQLENELSFPDTDLGAFQRAITSNRSKVALKGDGSLMIIHAKRETEAASYLAKLFQKNPSYRPLCVITEKNRALDTALTQEGLPSLGILSASLARPSLQILKLISTFLWEPIDPFKILEFVSLAVKPLRADLALKIADLMAKTPGVNSDRWFGEVNRYFTELEERAKEDTRIDVAKTRFQYQFWFERNRFDRNRGVPKEEVIELFDYLAQWSHDEFEESNGKNTSFAVLREQAKRVQDLLETLPETKLILSELELEQIVRTIYEPSPVSFRDRETASLPYIHHTSAIIQATDELLWWNFVQNETDHFFSKWYKKEIAYLQDKGIHLQHPSEKNQVRLWQRKQPILKTRKRLILVIPEMVDGQHIEPHPLLGDFKAAFLNPELIECDISSTEIPTFLKQFFQLPQRVELAYQQLGTPPPFVQVPSEELSEREYESFTSLQALLYYPYQWVFKYKIKLNKSSILSVVSDRTLMGNLSHRFFELMFKEDIQQWDKTHTEKWIEQQAPRLFRREGAVLLMYGREPERLAFLNKVKYAAWSLVSVLQTNKWEVEQTEMNLGGTFSGLPIKAKADLVLRKGDDLAVVDLKWGGANYRQRVIKNEEDLQLVMYSNLLTEDERLAKTAYFILENGKMIARTNETFKEALAVTPESNPQEVHQRIYDKMLKTYEWRKKQLQEGKVEIRTKQTLEDLEDAYMNDNILDLLEMKDENAPFDDYRTLINLIQ